MYVQLQPATTYYYGHDCGYVRTGAWGDWDGDGVPNIYDRDPRYCDARAAYCHHGGWRDADHDGVANRYDRAPGSLYRY